MLAVAGLAAVAYLGLVLEDDYLFIAAVAFGRGQHPGAFDSRPAHGDVIAIGDEQDFLQLHRAAGLLQQVDVEGLAFGYLILFAAGFNYCVNFRPPKVILYQFSGWASI